MAANFQYHSVHSITSDPRKITSILWPAIFFFAGILVIIFSFHLTSASLRLTSEGIKTVGKVVDVKEYRQRESDGKYRISYSSIVQFHTQSGALAQTELNGAKKRGANIELIYDPEDPNVARGTSFFSFWGSPLISGFIGVIFSSLGAFLTLKQFLRRKEINWLIENGTRVKARIIGVNELVTLHKDTNNGYYRNHKSKSYKIICTYTSERNHKMTYESHPITKNPGQECIGQDIELILDPNRPKIYFVNVDSL